MYLLLRLFSLSLLLAAPTSAAERFGLDHIGRIVRLSDPQIAPDGRSVVVTVSRANFDENRYDVELVLVDVGRCCTARSKSLTSLCRLQSHPAQYVSGIPSAAILLSISHPIRCSTRCLANVRARISGPMIAL